MPDNQDLQQPLKIGEELTQYKIEKVLGRGGFGITYLAMDLNLERQVVIKEFFPKEQAMRSSGSDVQPLSGSNGNNIYQKSRGKFLTEGRTLAKFRHNNIALVLTAFPENNTAYLVMEYNKGEDLAEFIKKRNKPLDFTQIKKLFLPICKGLQALHKQNLLHLDIKPDNIYLPDKGEPYLIDFGGIRQFIASKDVSASFMVLTPGYAPAEQHSDTSKLGFYSDIYALGMTIYYALTLEKKLPQSTDRQQSLFEGDDDPLPLLADSIITKDYPKDFVALIEQSIQPNRKHRLQKIDDLISVLEGNKIKKQKTINKKTTSKINIKTQLPIKKIVIGLVILMFIGIGVWQIYNYQQEQEKLRLSDSMLYQNAETTNTIVAYQGYLSLCKLCKNKKQIQAQIDIIKQQKQKQQQDDLLYQQAQQNNTAESYINYVDNCNLCSQMQQAKIQVKDILRNTGWFLMWNDPQWLKEIKQELDFEFDKKLAAVEAGLQQIEEGKRKAEQQRQADLKAEQERQADLEEQQRQKEQQRQADLEEKQARMIGKYYDNDDGTVTDTETGYMWMRCAIGQEWDYATCQGYPNYYSRSKAKKIAKNTKYAGYSDWLLPDIKKLNVLIYCSNGKQIRYKKNGYDAKEYEGYRGCDGDDRNSFNSPTINQKAFPNTSESEFWSISKSKKIEFIGTFVNIYGETMDKIREKFWISDFYDGVDGITNSNEEYSVRLYRKP